MIEIIFREQIDQRICKLTRFLQIWFIKFPNREKTISRRRLIVNSQSGNENYQRRFLEQGRL